MSVSNRLIMLNVIMLHVVMPSVIMLNDIMLHVVMPSVIKLIMLSVVTPTVEFSFFPCSDTGTDRTLLSYNKKHTEGTSEKVDTMKKLKKRMNRKSYRFKLFILITLQKYIVLGKYHIFIVLS